MKDDNGLYQEKNSDFYLVALFAIFVLLVFYQYAFSHTVLFMYLRLFLDSVTFSLSGILVVAVLNKNKYFSIKSTPFDIWVSFILCLFFISAILNGVPFLNIIYASKFYFFNLIVFYFIVYFNLWTFKSVQVLFKIILTSFFFQLIFQFFQYYYDYRNKVANDDSAFGFFQDANTLSYALLGFVFYSFYMVFVEKNIKYFKFLIATLISMIVASGEFAILMFPYLCFLYFWRNFLNFRFLFSIVMLVSVFIVFVFVFYELNPQGYSIRQDYGGLYLFSFEHLHNRFFHQEFNVSSGSARFIWFPVTLDALDVYAFGSLIGIGPGMYASFAAWNLKAVPTMSVYNFFNQIQLGVDPFIDPQIIVILGELGYFGVILYFLFFTFNYFAFKSFYSKSIFPVTRGLNITASALSVYFLVGLFVNKFIEIQNLFLVYVLFSSFSIVCYKLEKNYQCK